MCRCVLFVCTFLLFVCSCDVRMCAVCVHCCVQFTSQLHTNSKKVHTTAHKQHTTAHKQQSDAYLTEVNECKVVYRDEVYYYHNIYHFVCRVTYFHSFESFTLNIRREISKLQAVEVHMHHRIATTCNGSNHIFNEIKHPIF